MSISLACPQARGKYALCLSWTGAVGSGFPASGSSTLKWGTGNTYSATVSGWKLMLGYDPQNLWVTLGWATVHNAWYFAANKGGQISWWNGRALGQNSHDPTTGMPFNIITEYDKYVISGATGIYASDNGVYKYNGIANGMVGFINSNGVLMQYTNPGYWNVGLVPTQGSGDFIVDSTASTPPLTGWSLNNATGGVITLASSVVSPISFGSISVNVGPC